MLRIAAARSTHEWPGPPAARQRTGQPPGRAAARAVGSSGRSAEAAAALHPRRRPRRRHLRAGRRGGRARWAARSGRVPLALVTRRLHRRLLRRAVEQVPARGGAALYVHHAFRTRLVTFMVAFAVMASGVTSAAALARGFGGDYLSEFVDVKVVIAALALLALIALVNFRGISESVRINLGFTIVEVLGLRPDRGDRLGVALRGGDADTCRAFEFDSEGTSRVRGDPRGHRALLLRADRLRGLGQRRRGGSRTPAAVSRSRSSAASRSQEASTCGHDRSPRWSCPTDELARSSGPLLEVVKQGPLNVPERSSRRSGCSRCPTAH